MREILFRGKSACGAWIQGDLIHRKIWHSEFEVIRVDDSGFDNYTEYEVATETIGQYTNLTDKNGKKIFEGDIVKYGDTVHNVVFEQRNGTAYFGLVYSPLETLPCGHYQDLRQIEVIGNIHDNPELLKGGE